MEGGGEMEGEGKGDVHIHRAYFLESDSGVLFAA